MAELTVAVVGCGGMGNVHLRCWANLSGARIAAVCDQDGVTAARTAMLYDGVAAFVELQDALAMGPFDIVDICAPPDQHYAAAEIALRAGCNVLCEKPLTPMPEAAWRLVQLAAERERLLMTAFCHRFHPPLLFAKDLVESDDLGHPTIGSAATGPRRRRSGTAARCWIPPFTA
jgi:UDP-N-acetylglucosamine 3-dehydrogenase